jgi:hypothetical protein
VGWQVRTADGSPTTAHRPSPLSTRSGIRPGTCAGSSPRHTARTHTTDRPLGTTADLDALPTVTSKWLFTQCATYGSLHHEQHQLLAGIG